MKDFEPQEPQVDNKVIATEQRQARSQQMVERVPIKPGHKMFELDLATGILSESILDVSSASFETGKPKKKLVTKPNHYYLSALNAKNAVRKFNQKVKEWAALAAKDGIDLNGKEEL